MRYSSGAVATLEEFNACVELQREVWGFSDLDLVPLRVFSVASKIGGQVIGAWDGDTMVGFSLSTAGDAPALSLSALAHAGVKEGYRNTGLGRRIKLFQREDAIALGYELIEWTFDPLEIKNAYFNLERLGAIARRYNLNQYGITTSPLQGFLPTDRLVAEWWLKSRARGVAVIVGPSAGISTESCRSQFPPRFTPGRRRKIRVRKPRRCRRAIASCFLMRLPKASPAWATGVMITAAASF